MTYRVFYNADGEMLFMAGLWSTWRPKDAAKDAPPLLSCTIITTEAGPDVAAVHDRMPAIHEHDALNLWLEARRPDADRAAVLVAMTKFFRLFVQILILGIGAYLVLQQELTSGASIAGSIGIA